MKIPGARKVCGNQLDRDDMETWIDTCEKVGKDPMDAAKGDSPGILCFACFKHRLAELAVDAREKKDAGVPRSEIHPLELQALRFTVRLSAHVRGMRVIK